MKLKIFKVFVTESLLYRKRSLRLYRRSRRAQGKQLKYEDKYSVLVSYGFVRCLASASDRFEGGVKDRYFYNPIDT